MPGLERLIFRGKVGREGGKQLTFFLRNDAPMVDLDYCEVLERMKNGE